MMTREEQTGERNLDFSLWVRVNLPDSYLGYRVSDLDFILANERTKKVILLEIKSHCSGCRPWQKRLFSHVDRWVDAGIKALNDGWEYLGFHYITEEWTTPDNGGTWFDGESITREELIKKLSC